jgi:hypothetical protein
VVVSFVHEAHWVFHEAHRQNRISTSVDCHSIFLSLHTRNLTSILPLCGRNILGYVLFTQTIVMHVLICMTAGHWLDTLEAECTIGNALGRAAILSFAVMEFIEYPIKLNRIPMSVTSAFD